MSQRPSRIAKSATQSNEHNHEIKDREANRKVSKQTILGVIILSCFFVAALHSSSNDALIRTPSIRSVASSSRLLDYDVSQECKNLPFIRPLGSYFKDSKIGVADSAEGIEPRFKIGSLFGEKAKWHMGDDKPHFDLAKELLANRKGGLVLDIGANQGFYTWYLATLGMDVHAFEIFEDNVKALQHGAEHNPPEVAKRVHIYPVGLGETTGRMSMGGSNYEGHLKNSNEGRIQTTSFDCFAYHNIDEIGTALISDVAFVKLDVEGFEIAVLRGAKKSLFGPNGRVGGMIMEVGPARWSRAGVDYESGVAEMKELSTHFKKSYLIVRSAGSYMKTCPLSLATKLADKKPREMQGVKVFEILRDELDVILKDLSDIKGDCNFWYTN